MAFRLESPASGQAEAVPGRCGCDGGNVAPPLEWSGVADGTVSLMLVCDDADAPRGVSGHPGAHGIPPTGPASRRTTVRRPSSRDPRQAVNDFGKPGYAGPCPPRAYRFRLIALSTRPTWPAAGARVDEIEALARPHITGFVELVGYRGR